MNDEPNSTLESNKPAKLITRTIFYRNSFVGGDGWTYHPMGVVISANCPICGGPRGEAKPGRVVEDSETFNVDEWVNACGHVDTYKNCFEESMALIAASAAPAAQANKCAVPHTIVLAKQNLRRAAEDLMQAVAREFPFGSRVAATRGGSLTRYGTVYGYGMPSIDPGSLVVRHDDDRSTGRYSTLDGDVVPVAAEVVA